MEPEYNSDSTTDTATSDCVGVYWGGQLVYDNDIWGFKSDLKEIWDETAAQSILNTVSDGPGLILLHKLVQITADTHANFIKSGVFKLLVTDILESKNIVEAVATLYHLIKNVDKTSDLPNFFFKLPINAKLAKIMLRDNLLDTQHLIIGIMMKIWKYFPTKNEISTEQCKIAMGYAWGIEKYCSCVVADFGSRDKDKLVKMANICASSVKLLYQLMKTFDQFTNVKPVIDELLWIALQYGWTGFRHVWMGIYGCIMIANSYCTSTQRLIISYMCLNSLKLFIPQTQEMVMESLWLIMRDTKSNQELAQIFDEQFLQEMFSVENISTKCMSTLLDFATKFVHINGSILIIAIPLIEQVFMDQKKYSKNIALALQLIEKILAQPDGYESLQEYQVVQQILEYCENKLVPVSILKVLDAKGHCICD